jgi:hypothetical protein
MRWILPLLSFSLISSALAERAVYTGSLKVQNLASPASNVVRVAEVIDLESGKIVTVALTGTKLNFTFNVGSEIECVIAKAVDAKGHSATAFAQAAAAIDSTGSKFALSTMLRGSDVAVTLGDSGASHWPRTLIGSGSLVAGAGADAASTPGGISVSTISVTLSEPWSRLANSSGGTLEQCAEVVAQVFRDAVAKSLKYPAASGSAASAGGTTTSTGSPVTTSPNIGGSVVVNANIYTGATGTQNATLDLYPSFGGSLGVTGAGTQSANALSIGTANSQYASLSSIAGSISGSASLTKTGMGLLTLAPSTFNPPVSATLGGSVVLDVNGSNTIGGSLSATTTLTNAGIIRLNPTGVATTTLGATNIVNGTGAVLVSNASTSGLVLNGNSTFTGGAFSLTAGTITGTSTLSNASIALGPINVLLPGTNPANALVPLTAESLAPFIASGAITELNAANLLQAIPTGRTAFIHVPNAPVVDPAPADPAPAGN